MIKKSDFIPAFGLGNPHIQTILPSILPSKELVKPTRRERLIMKDGDFVDFDWFAESTAPIVIILHGITGSIDSHYVEGMLAVIKNNGWRPLLMYYRGCSGESNLTDFSYHSGDTMGLDTIVKELRRREPHTPISAIGYSMGANVLLKWLGQTPEAATALSTAVAVSTPFDLRAASNRLRQGFSRFYQWWLIGDLHDYVRRKYQQKPTPFDFGDVTQLKTFWEFDDAITAPLNGFKDAPDYYEKSSCKQYLKNIQVPTLAIHALDDPFMLPETIPNEDELSSAITLELSEKGGHVGFISGTVIPFRLKFWLETRIPEHLKPFLNAPTTETSLPTPIIPVVGDLVRV